VRAALRRVRASGDAGTMSVFVVGLVVVLMALAGLVVDGGRAVNARAAAADDAEQAARAGANQLDQNELRASGRVVIDSAAAQQAATNYLAARGYTGGEGSVDIQPNSVRVAVSDDIDTTLLALVNIDTFHVTGSATARAAVGIDSEIGGAP